MPVLVPDIFCHCCIKSCVFVDNRFTYKEIQTMIYVLFLLCVLGFSVTACFSKTSETYLRDKNPKIWCWNWTLFVFAVVLANIVRLPFSLNDTFWIWFANLGFCIVTGGAVFLFTLFCTIAYHIFWPLSKSLFRP